MNTFEKDTTKHHARTHKCFHLCFPSCRVFSNVFFHVCVTIGAFGLLVSFHMLSCICSMCAFGFVVCSYDFHMNVHLSLRICRVFSFVCFPFVLSDLSCVHMIFIRMSTRAFEFVVSFHMFAALVVFQFAPSD